MLIEQRKSTGTADNVFTDRHVIAYTTVEADDIYRPVMVVKGYQSHEDWAEITPSWRVYSRYDGNREEYAGPGDLVRARAYGWRAASRLPPGRGTRFKATRGTGRRKAGTRPCTNDTDLWMDEEMES
jgi:hypothetical protein